MYSKAGCISTFGLWYYVKPYVKRTKTDAADAAAICEAVGRPHMRFVPIKSVDEQALAQAHKARSLLVAQRTALVNALRAHLTEFGIVAPIGPAGSAQLVELLRSGDAPIPDLAVEALVDLCDMLAATSAKIAAFDARLKKVASADEACRRLMKVPGIGPVAAGAIRALAGDVTRFSTGRDFAAWLGLTPRQNSSGGKIRLGGITKAGNRDLRSRARADVGAAQPSRPPRQGRSPGGGADRAQAAVGGGGGDGRQDREDHLGHVGARRSLSSEPRRTSRLTREEDREFRRPPSCGGEDHAREVMTNRTCHRGKAEPAKRRPRHSAFR